MSDDEKPLIEAVLEHYGSTVKARATFMTSCPLHDDRTPSLSVNTTKQVWRCHSCGEAGDSYALLMKKEDLDFAGARALAASLDLAAGGAGGGGVELRGSAYGGRRRTSPRKGDRPRNGSYVPAWRRRD